MAALMPQGKQQYFTAGGIPLVGGKVYTYAAGTTTPLATYTTAAASTPNANPVILDSRGEASIFFSAANYKIVVKDSLDSTIWTQDNLAGDAAATIVANLAASTGSSLVGYLPAGTGVVATTVQAKLRESVSVKDFGAVGDGVTDDTVAVQAFFTYLAGLYTAPKSGVIPPGNYKVTSKINWAGGGNVQAIRLYCEGRILGNFATAVLDIQTAIWIECYGLQVENTSTAAGSRAVNMASTYAAKFFGGIFMGGEYTTVAQGNGLEFYGTEFKAGTNGFLFTGASNVTSNLWMGCFFETNTNYGLIFDTSGGAGYGKQAVKNCYFESNVGGDIYVNAAFHSLNIEENHFSFNESHDAIIFGAAGGGTVTWLAIRDNYFVINGAYTVNAVKQSNTAFMRGARVSGNKMTGPVGSTGILYTNAPYVIEEFAALYPVQVLDNIFATGTGWTSGGGAAPVYGVSTGSPYGVGFSVTKADQYIKQTIAVKANTLYRVTCWANIGGGSVGVQIWDSAISVNQSANIFGATSTTSTTPELLEFYWMSGSLTSAAILLRQLSGAFTFQFSDLQIVNVTTPTAY